MPANSSRGSKRQWKIQLNAKTLENEIVCLVQSKDTASIPTVGEEQAKLEMLNYRRALDHSQSKQEEMEAKPSAMLSTFDNDGLALRESMSSALTGRGREAFHNGDQQRASES